jgi:hypothetical protein
VRDEYGSCTETSPPSSGEGNQFVFVNVDDVTRIKQEDDPEPTTSTVIKTDPVVSFMAVCVQCCVYIAQISRNACVRQCVHVFLQNIWKLVTVF